MEPKKIHEYSWIFLLEWKYFFEDLRILSPIFDDFYSKCKEYFLPKNLLENYS